MFDRIRRWFDRGPHAADPADLQTTTPEDPAATTGTDRPFPEAGPVAEAPVDDPPETSAPERPLG